MPELIKDMDIYILDSLFRPYQIVDLYKSFIWTERWRAYGDFELVIASTFENRSRFIPGTRLGIKNSRRIMVVEVVEDVSDDDGMQVLEIKGRSIEAILQDRVALENFSVPVTEDTRWVLEDTPGNVIREMFEHICFQENEDNFPFIKPYIGPLFPAAEGYWPEPEDSIRWEQEPASLYDAIREVCIRYDIGFRITREPGELDPLALYFVAYTGVDRTGGSPGSVIFSANLDSLQNTTELNSIQRAKNVAYVVSSEGNEVVVGNGADFDTFGAERKVILVQTTVDEEVNDISEFLTQKGREALRNNRAISMFDGEVDPFNQYQYGQDYGLGDLVEVRNRDGETTKKRVTEQIFVSDGEGARSYPTLSMGMFETTDNTWRIMATNPATWDTVDPNFVDATWDEM